MPDNRLSRRVLFVAPSAYTVGGLATWLDYLVPGLEARGWEVTVALASGRFHDAARYRSVHRLSQVVEIGNPTGSREGRIRALERVIADQRPSLVASVNIADSLQAVARLRSQADFEVSAVMTVHGVQPDLFEDCRHFAPFLAGVVCTNRLACALAQSEGRIEASRVHYAPGGVEIPDSGVRSLEPSKRLRIAYVGRFERFHKRIQDIPPIIRQLAATGARFEFLLVGEGPEDEWLRNELAQPDLQERVTILGSLDRQQVFERVYRVADVLLVTSFSETGPLVAWEAMANRVTLVSTSYVGSGLEGALEHQVNCLQYPVGNTSAAAEQLQRATDGDLRKRLTTAAFQLVQNRYSIEASVAAWSAAFQSVLEKPPLERRRPPPVPGAGRLDRLLGTSGGEQVRAMLGRSFRHTGPGGEWPHSYGTRPLDDRHFWRSAEELDRSGSLGA